MHLFKVHFRMKLTYRTLPTDDDPEVQQESEFLESGRHSEFETHNKIQWDDDCPWSEWYSAEDPVKGEPSIMNIYLILLLILARRAKS